MPAKKKETQPQKKVRKKVTKKAVSKKNSSSEKAKKSIGLSTENNNFPIVGIGSSAGGLEALELFFSNLPPETNMAFVIIQHLSPRHKSIMAEILMKYTQMKVLAIQEGKEIKPNCVYLNPPDKNVVILNRRLYLTEPTQSHGVNLPIDCFFRSLSEDQGEKAICIILSGTATDGTLGLKAIKGEGGIAMVQQPDSAKYSGMPNSAIATGLVDFILPVEKIPAELIKYVQHPYIERHDTIETTKQQFKNFVQKILVLIRTNTGHDFANYKQTTIHRRIERRMAVHQLDKIEQYATYLKKKPAEIGILFKDLLIGVTNFFRDADAFEILKSKVIPELIKNKESENPLRIWIAGCATGEEAYSIAILVAEVMDELRKQPNIQIFASDIDNEALDFARMAVYPDSIAADVSSQRLNRYFIKEDNTYRIKKQIREMIVFANQNLIKDPPFSRLDLVSCRNLLIYMGPKLQKKILPLFHYTLNPQGNLFLGTSESIGEFSHLFSPIDQKWKIFNRKEYVVDNVRDYPRTPFYDVLPTPQEIEEKRTPTVADIHNLAERIVLDNYAPPCVLINEQFEILHFIGQTDKYLAPPVGKANFSVLNMAREGLKYKLSTALHDAVKQKKTVLSTGIKIKHSNSFRTVDLVVRPLTESGFTQGFMLVMFEDKTPPVTVKANKTAAKEIVDPYLLSLEKELQSTKEYLQTTNEELETSNEELKSTNEELQSVNEELQSTNEELETSKEELQSTNEELVTVNAELQKKVDELSMTNNDMKNLLDSVDIPTIFLDTDLRIKRFTAHATKVINLIHTDIGRPIDDIATKIESATLSEDAKAVLEDLVSREKEVMSKDGSCYSMRILPYRTTENVIDGVVITFQDFSERKQAEEGRKRLLTAVEQERDKLRTLIDSIADEIWFCDAEGNLALANKAALSGLGFESIKEVVQPMVEWLPKLQIFTPDGRSRAEEAAPLLRSLRGEAQKEVEEIVRHPRTGEKLHRRVSSTPIRDNSGEIIGAVAVVHDITEGKRAEQSLRKSEQRYRILFEMATDSNVLIDVETKGIVAFNRSAHERLGYTREEFAKLVITDFETVESPDGVERHIAKIIKKGSDVFETHHKTKDGEIRRVQVKAKAISIGEQKLILSTWDYITPADSSG